MINLVLKSQTAYDKRVEKRKLKEFTQLNIHAVDFVCALIFDVKNNLPARVYSEKAARLDCISIKERYNYEGLSFITQKLPKLSANFLSHLETGVVDYPGFIMDKSKRHPVLLGRLFSQVLNRGEYDKECFRGLYQILVSFTKFRGPYPESVLSEQLADFVKVDEELADIDMFDKGNLQILNQARAYLYDYVKTFSSSDSRIIPRPGPGATNKRVANNLRYRPHVVYNEINKVMPVLEFFTVHPYDVVNQTKIFLDAFKQSGKRATARLKYVFKKYMKARGICIEENDVQFLQQAIKNWFYETICASSVFNGCIDFRDQSINQLLALTSSENLERATIDMSEASDRIFRLIVSWLFQDNQELHDILMALSTKLIVLPKELISGNGGSTIKTNKYAPMGSGLCFPIMTLVHWALIKSILFLHNGTDEDVYVYGDDIIVPSHLTELVYKYLPRFGMKLNVDKSFFRSHFRESCGVHGYFGRDVTPVYIKYIPNSTSIQAAMSCIASESQFHKNGYALTAELFRKHMIEHFSDLPYVPEHSPIFGFRREGNFFPKTLKKVTRKKDKWGNSLFRFRTIVGRRTGDQPPTEHERYLRHVLTKDNVSWVGERPDDFDLVWRDLALSQVFGFKSTFNINDERCSRDVAEENKYDFTQLDKRSWFHRCYLTVGKKDSVKWRNTGRRTEFCARLIDTIEHIHPKCVCYNRNDLQATWKQNTYMRRRDRIRNNFKRRRPRIGVFNVQAQHVC